MKKGLNAISQILRKELPGMRVYSETQMKEMRLFYEAWTILDPNSLVATGESSKSTSTLAELQTDDFQEVAISTIANVELGPLPVGHNRRIAIR